MRNGGIPVISKIAIVQTQSLEPAMFFHRMYMHLSNTLCLVSVCTELFCEHVIVVPVDTILISDTSVVLLTFPGKKRSSCRDTAWTGGIGAVKEGTIRSERVKVRCLDVRMSGIGKTVSTKLVTHKK